MPEARLPAPLRHLLIDYLQATRHLRAAARHDDLDWFQTSLDERQRILEELNRLEVAVADRPRVRRLAQVAEICAARAHEALLAAGEALGEELGSLREHRQRGAAFRRSLMSGPHSGTWLDLSS